MTRRQLFSTSAAAAMTAAVPSLTAQSPYSRPRKGKLKQAVTGGCFGRGTPFETQCWEAARMGFQGFDLKGPTDFEILKKYKLVPSMVPGGGGTIPTALNRVENHDRIEKEMRPLIDICAASGCPDLITFSGNRKGMSDAEGADNCVTFLNKVKAQAEDKGVTICVELLNSKVDHKDYMCDKSAWGIEVCKRVNSPRVKLLFDIYHMQIMEGDIVRTIRDNLQYFAHFHTGGNPGRHEIDDTQELNYKLVAKTLSELDFQGFIAHEYSPAKGSDPIKCLEYAFEIFDV
jgi:hydroxypyruvate isomerase